MLVPCNEEKERKGKIEDPSGRDFSAKEKQGEVVFTLGLTWQLHQAFSSNNFLWKDKIKHGKIRDKAVDTYIEGGGICPNLGEKAVPQKESGGTSPTPPRGLMYSVFLHRSLRFRLGLAWWQNLWSE